MPRADTRTQSNKDFGKPGISFPYDDKAYPAYTLTVDNFQNQTLPAYLLAYGASAPGYINAPGITVAVGSAVVLTGITRSEGDNQNADVQLRYETLPGPWLPYTRIDDQMGLVYGQRRAVIANPATQTGSISATTKLTYSARGDSDLVSWEIVELYGTGISGNSFPTLSSSSRSGEVRGRNVDTSSVTVAAGTSPDTGSLVISSVVTANNSALSTKRTTSITSLPPDERWAYWDWVSLPLCVLDIVHTIYCNDTPFVKLVTNYDTQAGSSVLRKHRRTISYSSSVPNLTPDLSSSAYSTADLQYAGNVININLNNVLNDALSYSEDFAYASTGSFCSWTEEYDFPATTPDATTFLAGLWVTKGFNPDQFGQSMFRITHDEYYSAQGNPDIT